MKQEAESLRQHLAWWGLRHLTVDTDYFTWQRHALNPTQLAQLTGSAERKRSGDSGDEIAFYDLSADATVFPILYSQRYEYYEAVGSRVAAHIEPATAVLDFGCGPGILTTFYARQCPHVRFVGLDRSPASIALARQRASALGLTNVTFSCWDVIGHPFPDTFDLVIATHALVQNEQDPGLPSRDWTTFERARDVGQQQAFESRTGIGPRLDGLCASLVEGGRLILFEKTRQLARRVPLQRALAGRDLSLLAWPEPVRYRTIEEVSDDGPLFVVGRGGPGSLPWDESPEPDEGLPFDANLVDLGSRGHDVPLYENHWPSAQRVWEGLEGRSIVGDCTRGEPDGRQMHVEWGTAGPFAYLYCANTFDQRQVVIMEQDRAGQLVDYYRDIVDSPSPAK